MSTTIFSDIFLPITLAIITLGLGLSITIGDIKNIIFSPKNITIGLLSQLILLPLIALVISFTTGLQPEYAVGLIIIAVCPGGATANLVNYMIRGNVALSLSITVINGLITIFTIPLLTTLALHIFLGQDSEIQLSIPDAVLKIFLLTVVPAGTGIIIQTYKKEFARKLEKPLRYILPVLLLLVYSGVLFFEQRSNETGLAEKYFNILPFALTLNILAMTAGYFIPSFFGISKQNKFTISVEVGLQNSTLAIFVAGTLLNNYTIALVPVVYGSFSFFTTWLFGYLARRFLR
jgi:BASS family bile acid:Na+ symporter